MKTEMGIGGLTEQSAAQAKHANRHRERTLELVEFLGGRAGDALCWVAYYDATVYELLYTRTDLEGSVDDGDVTGIISHLRFEAPLSEESIFPYESLRATVRLFDDAVVIHMPQGCACGVVVSLDQSAARNLKSFITDCEVYL
ncbi:MULTISPECIES: hypothetical protein [unclassified Haladaptatus]|uniref:hypothetical protein n=1 Tax=unclassified Haladaptatus TaxID=2622732 RepID=UPI0023E810CA|nr:MULTISPECIES: hypothetical protein [unclassified Haladaptatus]